jgi:hypothetical protein
VGNHEIKTICQLGMEGNLGRDQGPIENYDENEYATRVFRDGKEGGVLLKPNRI